MQTSRNITIHSIATTHSEINVLYYQLRNAHMISNLAYSAPITNNLPLALKSITYMSDLHQRMVTLKHTLSQSLSGSTMLVFKETLSTTTSLQSMISLIK